MRERCLQRALLAAGLAGAGAILAGCTGPGDHIYQINAETAPDPPVVDWTDDCLDGAPTVRRAVVDGDAPSMFEGMYAGVAPMIVK